MPNSVSGSRFRAYLELLRLPNVFTAMADICMGFLVTHESLNPVGPFLGLLGASSAIYLAGMVLNDVFDQQKDATERPRRPIPSGRVSLAEARRLGIGLLALGLILGWGTGLMHGDYRPGIVTTILIVAVWLYDGLLKQTPLAPPMMGCCRLLNVLLGMSLLPGPWHPMHAAIALGLGVYIMGVTLFARTEAQESSRLMLGGGLVFILGGMALLASYPLWVTQDLALESIPQFALETRSQWFILWGVYGAISLRRGFAAVRHPTPQRVQGCVKNYIWSLIFLDAVVCAGVQGMVPAAWILLLLIPTMFLGRFIYST